MRILITGASGFIGSQLGVRLARSHEVLGITFRSSRPLPFPSQPVDLTDERSVALILREFGPEVIVHAAAMSRVLECEQDPRAAHNINVDATGRLARWAERGRAKLIFLSSDQVFSGRKGLYIESDFPDPINSYGRSKLAAEQLVLEASSANLVVRSNSVMGSANGRGESFSDWILSRLQSGQRVSLFHDQYRSPIHIRTVMDVLESACVQGVVGMVHVGGSRRLSRADVGFALARAYALGADLIDVVSVDTHANAAVMPRDTSYKIAHLRQAMPYIRFRSLEDEFVTDAREAEVPN